ncbi:MAG TPA: DUF4238 domain-containing protein [Clostridia bacterium]|nr:DUF4238 domain-containing protein [Clostridia bacterium]
MKKRNSNIKQHYIPQCYLRNFTDKNDFLHVYNYKSIKYFKVKPSKVSWGRYFHDVNVDLFNRILETENAYDEIVDDKIRLVHEKVISRTITQIRHKLSNIQSGIFLNKEERANLVDFVMIQYIRTPEYRNGIDYLPINFVRYYFDDIHNIEIKDSEYLPTIHNLIIYGLLYFLNNEYPKISNNYDLFFGHLFDEYSVMMEQLDKGFIRFFVNKTNIPFITTTNPINVEFNPNTYSRSKALVVPKNKSDRVFDMGSHSEIFRVFVPLSSNIGIMFFDEEFARSLEIEDNKIQVINDEDKDIIINLNLSMASKCEGTLYSENNEYKKLQELIDAKSYVNIKLFR